MNVKEVDYVSVGTDSQSKCMYRSKYAEKYYGRDHDNPSVERWFNLTDLFSWYGSKLKIKKICDGKDVWKLYD